MMMKYETTIESMIVDPHLASEWLAKNTNNRHIRRRLVNAYADDMKTGRWNGINGETIKIGRDGTLIDGQHRLHAVIEADVEVRMFVVFNAPSDSVETIDTGARRTFSDILKMRGEADTAMLAAITRNVHLWTHDGWPDKFHILKPSNPQLLETWNEHSETIRPSSRFAHWNARDLMIPGSILGLCHWVLTDVDEEECDFFFMRLVDGQNMTEGNPIYALRKTLQSRDNTNIGWTKHSRKVALSAMIFKAWNAFRDGDRIYVLRFNGGGSKPEKFPEVK